MKCATKAEFAACAADAEQRESTCRVTQTLLDAMDPDGVNIVWLDIVHNDCEVRTIWMVKITGQDLPAEVCLDISFEAFAALPELLVNKAGTLWARGLGLDEVAS